MTDLEHKIKIGVSGNTIGSAGYACLINIGFNNAVVSRQIAFRGCPGTEYCIEVQQGESNAVFTLVANPMTVYSSGASRAGALCVFLSIPDRKFMKTETPLSLLKKIWERFRENYMVKKENGWEFIPMSNYDSKPFYDLIEPIVLDDLPTYVPMEGDSELLVSIGPDRLDKFFEGDFQYSDFNKCSRLIIADQIIDGSSWENVTIPRTWSLKVKFNSQEVAELHSSNDKNNTITRILGHPDKVCYKPTEIKLWLDGYQVKTNACVVKKIDWERNEVLIDKIDWNLCDRFVPICFDGVDVNISPDEIVCTFDDGMHPKVDIKAMKNPDEVLGFEFWGTQIRTVKENMFHISNDSYNFTVSLKYENGLPEEIHIIAEQKTEPKQETVQTQTSSLEPLIPTATLPTASIQSQFSQSAQDYANNNPKTGNCNEGETAGHIGENLHQKPSTQKQGTETNTSNNVTDGVSEVKKESEESKFKFYRKKEFWIGLAAGIILGFGMGFLTWSVYNNLLKSDYEKFLNYQKPTEREGNLFLYDENELNEAIDLCVRANSLSNSRKVISEQAEHFKNLLYNLEDNGYKLKFEDPAIIKKWVENEKIDSLGITDIDNIKKCIDAYSKFGGFLNTIINSQDRVSALGTYRKENGVDNNQEGTRNLLKGYNDELNDSKLKSIRICIQTFYLANNDGKLKCENLCNKIFALNEKGKYDFTSNCFIDIYKEAQPIIDPQQ